MSSYAFIVMGVSGSGKSTIAAELAKKHNSWQYVDADSFHSEQNIAKMKSGTPLTDSDRQSWLQDIHASLHQHTKDDHSSLHAHTDNKDNREKDNQDPTVVFLACSALKKAYRDTIAGNNSKIYFIFLKGSKELIAGRLEKRKGHYMPASLLDSQFNTLEAPDLNDEEAKRTIVVSIDGNVEEIVEDAHKKIKDIIKE